MNTPKPLHPILVWDLPTRLFHWSLAVCFAGAWLTSESQGLLHLLFGYSLFGLILFRLVWGFTGSRYARFTQFMRGPGAVWRYLRSLLRGKPEHSVGHNPAGAVAIALLLLLGLGTAITGWLMASGRAGESMEDVHEFLATSMLVVVGLHILAVIGSSVLHRENLTRAMVTGFKRGEASDAIKRRSLVVASAMAVALVGFWGYGLSQRTLPLGLAAAHGTGEGHAAADGNGERAEGGNDEGARGEGGHGESGHGESEEAEDD